MASLSYPSHVLTILHRLGINCGFKYISYVFAHTFLVWTLRKSIYKNSLQNTEIKTN